MKKVVLKSWVIKALFIISFICLLVLISDTEDIILFIITHAIALGIIFGNYLILKKYTDLVD